MPSIGPLTQKTTQLLEETPLEASSRQRQKFHEVESSLSLLSSPAAPTNSLAFLFHTLRYYLPPLSTQLFDNLTSYLGASNPLAYPATDPVDSVWLLDNTAFHPIDSTHPSSSESSRQHQQHNKHTHEAWHAEFIACYFARDTGKDISKWVADIADKVGLKDLDIPDEEGEKRIAERIRPFLDVARPARWVDVVLESEEGRVRRLGPCGRSAVSSQIVGPLGHGFKEGAVGHTKALQGGLTPLGGMRTYFAGAEGWVVISDIDDTIKITQTTDPLGILRNTFVSDPETTPGLPDLYATLNTTLSSPHWFYLSASPFALYPFLRPFLHSNYPHGTILLREASWINPAGLLQTLTQGVEAFKLSRIEKIHSWLPRRRVLCVGDSTQSDPEAYGEAYRKWPGWVKAIFIRKVTDVGGMEEKNEPERFEKAFEGVPRSAWRVFESTEELRQAVEGLRTL